MKINSLELNKYKRLMLANINHIKITPHSRTQAILGTNGSGKSSLLNELTPMPALPAKYGAGGSKIISITSRGHDYLLISDFSKTPPHSFIKDGEELNKGGNITVQKELVRQEFGIRQDIHELLTGKEKFSTMSPSRRREWFTELCETNYDYALSVHGKFKERSRDTSGALKLAKKRLVIETSKLASAADIDNVQLQIDEVVKEITALYESRVEEARSPYDIDKQQSALLNELQIISERLFSIKGHFGRKQIFTEEELRFFIDQKRHEITGVNTKIELLTKEHTTLKSALDEYAKTGEEGVVGLRNKREGLIKQREELWRRRKLKLEPVEPVGALAALESIHELLISVLTDMPTNEDHRFSFTNLNALQEKALDLKTKVHNADARLEKLRSQKEHLDQLKAGGDVECPKCTHKWVIGFTQSQYDKLTEVITEGTAFITTQKTVLAALEVQIQENTSYGNSYREISRCIKTVPALKAFWDHLLAGEHIQKSPTNVMRLIELLKVDLDLEIQAKYLDEQVTKTDDLIQIALKASHVDMGNVKTRIDTIETELGVLNREIFMFRNQLTESTQDCQKVVEIGKLDTKIKDYHAQLKKGFSDSVRATRNEIVNGCLNQLQIELAQKQNRLNDIKMQKGIVNDIEKNIETLTLDDQALKLVIDELSPTDGLIAEGLLGFIRSFVRKMNKLISKIWSYKMEVQDCSVSTDAGAELDYRFPVLIKTPDNVTPDVGDCSTGQREIIDLAFKIAAMVQLGLVEYPLSLDEPTSAMDVEHCTMFGSLMKYLLENYPFSQIWLISHDYVHYGSFGSIEACVLCPDNIVVPGKYNEHVEIS